MARNKYPEETVNRILDVSFRLFLEKGYDNTTIQDIIDHLGGLSKGAIYHHFKSKEEILDAVTDRISEESHRLLKEICRRPGLCGKEKLRAIFREAFFHSYQDDLFSMAPNLGDNPRMILGTIRDTVNVTVPQYILPVIEEGVKDGSIRTEYPRELAEMMMLQVNLWLNPMVFDDSPQQIYRKFMVFRQTLDGIGLDILDEEMGRRMQELAESYQRKKTARSE